MYDQLCWPRKIQVCRFNDLINRQSCLHWGAAFENDITCHSFVLDWRFMQLPGEHVFTASQIQIMDCRIYRVLYTWSSLVLLRATLVFHRWINPGSGSFSDSPKVPPSQCWLCWDWTRLLTVTLAALVVPPGPLPLASFILDKDPSEAHCGLRLLTTEHFGFMIWKPVSIASDESEAPSGPGVQGWGAGAVSDTEGAVPRAPSCSVAQLCLTH